MRVLLGAAKWCTGQNVNKENMLKFLELLFYLFSVQMKIRSAALSLSFQTTDELIDFITALENKLMETSSSAAATAAETGVSPTSHQPNMTTPPSYAAAIKKPAVVYTYCDKVGQPEKKCLRRKADLRKTSFTGGPSHLSDTSETERNSSVKPKTTFSSREEGMLRQPCYT